MVINMINQAKEESKEKRQKVKASPAKKAKYTRGEDEELEVISEKPFVPVYKFNFMREFVTDSSPNEVFKKLEEY